LRLVEKIQLVIHVHVVGLRRKPLNFGAVTHQNYDTARGIATTSCHLSAGRFSGHSVRAMTDFPEWIEPMAATLTQERFTGDEWTFERKLDGIRLLAFKQGADVRLFSRTHNPQDIPPIAAAIAALPADELILDGELTWDRYSGFHVFDILWLDGHDVKELPLVERRALLDKFELRAPLHRVQPLDDAEPWTRACAEGWEGVIAKRLDSRYEQKRSKHWLKMKCELTQHFVVGGFTDPQGARNGLGALLVGYYEGPDLVFAGKVGTGFDTTMLNALRSRFDAAEIDTPPFTKGTGLPRVREHWVKPELVVRVAFIEWTGHSKLRHSRLLAIETDVDPRTVVRSSS
jgi:ATP-dependent DNA ligase